MLTMILTEEGYRTETASDGLEALARMRLAGPYVVLLDLMMPYQGDKVLRALKDQPEVRRQHWIILMSAHTDLSAVAMACGADNFLSKPFNSDQVLTVVQEGLREHPCLPSPDIRN